MSDINMTPLIDVMLVLLVIFIVAAPLMAQRLQLELPRVEGQPAAAVGPALWVSLTADGRLHLQDQALDAATLLERARAAAQRDAATPVHIHADRQVPYGKVAELLALLQAAGLSRIGFVTAAPEVPKDAGGR